MTALPDRRAAIGVLGCLVTIALALAGCQDASPDALAAPPGEDKTDDEFVGGGPPPSFDLDNGGGLRASPSAGLGDEHVDFGEGEPGSCFDLEDDDGDGRVDCEDPGCLGLRSCCVGDGACCSPVEGLLPDRTDFSACPGGAVADCEAGASPDRVFGVPPPTVEDGALHPGGDLFAEGGVVLEGTVDLRQHRTTVSAGFTPSSECGRPCVEAAAVSLVAEADVDAATVRPVASLRHVWDAEEVRLVIGTSVVGSWPEGDGFGEATWSLDLQPDGLLVVRRDGATLPGGELAYDPPGPARIVLHGRNQSAPLGAGAGVRVVEATTDLCDMPGSWTDVASVTVFDGADDAMAGVGAVRIDAGLRPSIATDELGGLVVAGMIDDVIRVGRIEGPGDALVLAPSSLAPTTGFEEGGVDHPELVARPDGGLAVLYTAISDGGRKRIGRADADTLEGPWSQRDDALLTGGDDGSGLPEDLDLPTVAITGGGTWALIVRVTDADGSTALRALASIDGGETFTGLPSVELAALTRDAPIERVSLVVHNGAWQLFVSRRDGARHRVDLYASDDLEFWRVVSTDVLGGEPDRAVDRFGARALDVTAGDDVLDGLFVGVGAEATSLVRARRPSPTFGFR